MLACCLSVSTGFRAELHDQLTRVKSMTDDLEATVQFSESNGKFSLSKYNAADDEWTMIRLNETEVGLLTKWLVNRGTVSVSAGERDTDEPDSFEPDV